MTSTAEQAAAAPPPPGGVRDARRRAGELLRAHPAIGAAVALLVFSALLTRWANTRPGFDPYGWIVWGHQTLHGGLNTNAAPSWKPLPYLFTVPYALAGHYDMWLWLITAVAISLSGAVFAGRIAYRLVDAPPDRRWAAWVAAIVAAGASLGIVQYFHFVLSAQSDPVAVALCLGAVDCHLSGRHRWAFSLLALAGLARPEAWAFQALYAIWAWRKVPSMRWFMAGWVVVMLALWFGIPALSAKTFFIAGQNALNSPRALHSDKVLGTVKRFLELYEKPILVAALLGFGLAIWKRNRTVLLLAACVALWVVIEIAFVLHGWPGVKRYVFEPAALAAVIGAIGIGWLLAHPPKIAGLTWPAVAVAAVLVVAFVPGAITAARSEHKDLNEQRKRTKVINELTVLVRQLGGPARFKQCGEPLTRLQYQSMVAWTLQRNVASIGWKYGPAVSSPRPIVLITPGPVDGWLIQSMHQTKPQCKSLNGQLDLKA
jgi:hypothetical protein